MTTDHSHQSVLRSVRSLGSPAGLAPYQFCTTPSRDRRPGSGLVREIGSALWRTAVYSAGPSPWFRPFTYLHTHQSSGPLSGTTRASRYQKGKRSSAIIAEGPRDASRRLKSCQLPRNSAGTTCTTSPKQIESRKPAQSTTQTPKQKTHTPV